MRGGRRHETEVRWRQHRESSPPCFERELQPRRRLSGLELELNRKPPRTADGVSRYPGLFPGLYESYNRWPDGDAGSYTFGVATKLTTDMESAGAAEFGSGASFFVATPEVFFSPVEAV